MIDIFNFQKEHHRGRRSYIIFILLSLIVPIISGIVYGITETAKEGTSLEVVLAIASLFAFLLSIIVWYLWFVATVQRLRDAGMSAKWALLYVIPPVGHILALYLFLIPSKDMDQSGTDKLLLVLFKLWNGNERLFVAFWYIFIPNIALQYMSGPPSSIAGQLLYLILIIYSYVSVWRCAPNHKNKQLPWGGIARAFILLRIVMSISILQSMI